MPNLERLTNIYLSGENAINLLRRHGVKDRDMPVIHEDERMLLATFTGDETITDSVIGEISVGYGVVSQGEDHSGREILSKEVTLFVDTAKGLQGQKYRNKERKIHVERTSGTGKQEIRKGVDLHVQTSMPRSVFLRKAR